jgi:CDP-glucose 4,6-dehydratase
VTTADIERLERLSGTRVLVTGHSGFKGTWLSSWLLDLGAHVAGFSLPPDQDPTNIAADAGLGKAMQEIFGDVRDRNALKNALHVSQPDLVIHMAAQSLVRPSYADPVGTFETNTMGTVNVLDAVRATSSVSAIIVVTSDKCYENREDGRQYSETDSLGGADPYSASKGAAEIVAASYRKSFFYDEHGPLLASVRAGNVLGVGDMSLDRLIPDLVRAIDLGSSFTLRNPGAIRPWQHVLEPLRAYLKLASYLLEGDRSKTGSWNMGPQQNQEATTAELVNRFVTKWGVDLVVDSPRDDGPPEAKTLRLDTKKTETFLGLSPKLDFARTVDLVVDGYRSQLAGGDLLTIIKHQTSLYTEMT